MGSSTISEVDVLGLSYSGRPIGEAEAIAFESPTMFGVTRGLGSSWRPGYLEIPDPSYR